MHELHVFKQRCTSSPRQVSKSKVRGNSALKHCYSSFAHFHYIFLGMHDIYRTDKLSTDVGENDVIFIAPINKWNPIFRSDKVHLLRNQSINQSDLSEIHPLSECKWPALNCSDSQLVMLITSSFVNMSSPSGSFSWWQRRTRPLLFATHVQQGFREEEKMCQVLTQQIRYLTWKVVIATKMY